MRYYKEQPVMITMAEAADLLGLSRSTIRTLCDRGEIASVRLGDRILVVRTEIERLVAEAMEQQQARRAAEAQLAEARATLKALPARRRQRRATGL